MSIKSGSLSLLLLSFMVFHGSGQADVVDFSLPDLQGDAVRLSDHRGKWVIVNFWATWCGPCLKEMPVLNRFYLKRRDTVVVLGINFEKIERERLIEFVEEMAVEYPILRIGEAPLSPFEPLKGLPSTFVISPAGHLIKRHVGLIDRQWLEQAVGG